jgi:hypothetical protein
MPLMVSRVLAGSAGLVFNNKNALAASEKLAASGVAQYPRRPYNNILAN